METNIIIETPEEVSPSQELADIKRKAHFTGTVIKTTLAGAVVDIGLDTLGVVHVSQLQADPVNRVEDIVQPGQTVDVWVRRVVPKKKRIELTMIKPLDLEWREIEDEMVIKGKVVRLEKFGAFIDIGAERPGLVHISEIAHEYVKQPGQVLTEGDEVEVKVLSVNRQKKQIKLSIKALQEPPVKEEPAPGQFSQRGERGERSERGGRERQRSSDFQMPEEEKAEPVPTAMEIALREAMARSQDQASAEAVDVKGKHKSAPQQQNELEQILSRTLQTKRK